MASKAITAQKTIIRGVLEKTLAVEFEATGSLIKRTTGSFVTDGFLVGMTLTTTDGTNANCGTITLVEALQLTVSASITDVASASKTLTAHAKIGEVKSFSGPGGQASDIDVTTLDSDAKEFRRGLADEGEITFETNLDPTNAGQQFCRIARAENVDPFGKRNFEVVFTDADTTTLEFEAFVKGFSISGGVDDVLQASIALRITGAVTWS